MIDLKQLLVSLRSPIESAKLSTMPIDLLVDWFERTPEARQVLGTLGLCWDAPIATPLSFQAALHPGGYVTVNLLEIIGPLLKVKEGPRCAPEVTITIEQVHPADRERVERAVKDHPDSKTVLEWVEENYPDI